MKYNFKTKELAWTLLIHKEAEEYKKFVGNDNLPDFKIIYSHNTNEKPNYSMRVDTYKRPSNLYVNSGFMLNKNFNYKSTLFHEFTHLWDSENLLIELPLNKKSKTLSLFTEFHASYIESLHIMGCKSFENYENASKDMLKNKINNHIELIYEYQSKYNLTKLAEDYHGLMNGYMYYYGCMVAKSTVFRIEEDIIHFDNIFDETLNLFYSALKFNIIDERILNLSYKINILLEELLKQDGGK